MSLIFNWEHFSAQDFADLQYRIKNEWWDVLPGGEYYGQIRIRDICYDIQIEWLDEAEEPYVTMSPFFPHDVASGEEPYQEMVPGMPFDTYDEGSIVITRGAFLAMNYLVFCNFADKEIRRILLAPVFNFALENFTDFWRRHDTILRVMREKEEK